MPYPLQGNSSGRIGRLSMKRLLFSAAVLALASVPAFAAKNQKTVNFPDAVTVGSTQLAAGDYKVTWTGTGSNAQVTLVDKDKFKATPTTVTAKVVETNSEHTGFTVDRQGNANVLQTLQLGKTTLVFANASSNGQ
jgi:hypothetical protein